MRNPNERAKPVRTRAETWSLAMVLLLPILLLIGLGAAASSVSP